MNCYRNSYPFEEILRILRIVKELLKQFRYSKYMNKLLIIAWEVIKLPDNKLIEKLITALQYEYRTYLEIYKIAEAKTDALVKNDASEIAVITEKERAMADQTLKLNKVREQILSSLAEDYNQEFKLLTLDKLIKLVNEPHKKQLGEIQIRMTELLGKLIAKNNINKRLIENAIKYLDFNIQLIAAPEPAVPTYGRSGTEISGGEKRSVLDIRY